MVWTTDIINITSTTTLDTLLDVYLVDATGGNITITLPPITTDGMQYKLKRVDNISANTVTVQGSGGQLIDGVATKPLYIQSSLEVQSYQTAWYVLLNSSTSRSMSKTLFASAFIQNNGNAFVTFAGKIAPQLVCSFYYPGSNIEPITSVSIIVAADNNNPNGNASLRIQGGATLVTGSYNLTSNTPVILTSTSVSNLPTGPAIIEFIVQHLGNNNKLAVYSLTVQ